MKCTASEHLICVLFCCQKMESLGHKVCMFPALVETAKHFFSKCLYQSTLPAIVNVSSSCSISLPTLDVFSLFHFSHSGGCIMGSHCVCKCVCRCVRVPFYFEIMKDSHAGVRKTQRSHMAFIQFLPIVTSCITTGQ